MQDTLRYILFLSEVQDVDGRTALFTSRSTRSAQRLVLRLLYVLRVCLFVCLSV